MGTAFDAGTARRRNKISGVTTRVFVRLLLGGDAVAEEFVDDD